VLCTAVVVLHELTHEELVDVVAAAGVVWNFAVLFSCNGEIMVVCVFLAAARVAY
jgi:hypothetical protein